jgi:hypothetical protein
MATSSEIRPGDSLSSVSNPVADRVLATHSRAGPRAGPSITVAARSHQATSAPAAASTGATSHSRSTPWSASHDSRLSSRSETASGSETIGRDPSSLRRASSATNCPVESSLLASRTCDDSRVRHVSSSSSIALVAAAAGLLIWWAMPAASVPRATSDWPWRAVDSIERAVW